MEYANEETDLTDNPHVAPPKTDGAKPFVKWAGGKRLLVPKLIELMPPSFGAYHEPFIGGGSVFFELHNSGLLAGKQIFLSDACPELVIAHLVVRDHVDDLIAQLTVLRALPHDKTNYNRVRAQDPATLTDVERAARMIYLNKTGFNGLYRVNRQSVLNVPIGRHKTVSIPGPDLLRADSRALQGAVITCADFRTSLKRVQAGDFVYLDPPYDEAKFTAYCAGGFSRADQEDLAVEFERLAGIGAYVTMSNSASDWVRQRYAAFRQVQVMAPRSVNSNPKGRAPVPELVILSWELGVTTASPTVLAPLAQTRSPAADAVDDAEGGAA